MSARSVNHDVVVNTIGGGSACLIYADLEPVTKLALVGELTKWSTNGHDLSKKVVVSTIVPYGK